MAKELLFPRIDGTNRVSTEFWPFEHHDGEGTQRSGRTLVRAFTFKATLTLDTISRGRSAANFIFRDASGDVYSMFLIHFLELVKTYPHEGVHVDYSGWWTWAKRGQNYGLKWIGAIDADIN